MTIREHTLIGQTLAEHGPLRYLSSNAVYSTYEDRDGEWVWVQHGTGISLLDFDEVDWRTEWDAYASRAGRYYFRAEAYLTDLRTRVINPGSVDDLGICRACAEIDWEDDLVGTGIGFVCGSCAEDMWTCSHCDERWSSTHTIGDLEVCEGCLEDRYTYCEDCDCYFRDGTHDHDRTGCCTSPALQFAVRNNGHGLLANDTRTTVPLPAGVITEEGLGIIATEIRRNADIWYSDLPADERTNEMASQHARQYLVSYSLADKVGTRWQTKEGNFTKRLMKHAHKNHQVKLNQDLVSRIGCLARDHSSGQDFEIEVTRDLNQSRDYFANDGSCWWSEYAQSRCALKTNGGFGIRSFEPGTTKGSWNQGCTGRAWVQPLKWGLNWAGHDALVQTFDTEDPAAFVVFNTYGDLDGYVAARIVAHMAGWTYRKIEFKVDENEMYVNNDTGYLIAPEEIAEEFTDGSLSLSYDDHADLFHKEHVARIEANEKEHAHV